MTSRKVEKLKSEKGQKIALSTCQLFNLSTKRKRKWIEDRKK